MVSKDIHFTLKCCFRKNVSLQKCRCKSETKSEEKVKKKKEVPKGQKVKRL